MLAISQQLLAINAIIPSAEYMAIEHYGFVPVTILREAPRRNTAYVRGNAHHHTNPRV